MRGWPIGLTCLPLIVLSLCCLHVLCQPLTPDERQEIDTLIQGLMACKGLPGALVSAVRNGETAMADGYGVANLDTGAPVWPDTIFNIASVTKQFTALLLSKLMAQRNDFTWDTPIRDILGEDIYYSTGYRTNNTNLRDLLAHKTGIPRNDFQWFMHMVEDRMDIIRRMRFFEPAVDLRSSFIYNNLQYLLAGIVAERLEGSSWEDLIREHFFGPIGMSDSTFVDQDGGDRQRFATPYLNVSGEWVEAPFELYSGSGLVGPSGSISSTADDMALWLNFLLTGQGSGGQQVMNLTDIQVTWEKDAFGSLRPDSLNVFQKPSTPVSWSQSNYGKGFSLGYFRGHQVASHGGDSFGYHSVLLVLPDMDVGVFVSINALHGDERRLMALHVLDVLLGETPWLNVSYACNFPPPGAPLYSDMTDLSPEWLQSKYAVYTPAEVSPMARNLSEYVGTYGNFGYGNVTIGLSGETGNLTASFEARLGTFELVRQEEDVFLMHGVGDAQVLNLIVFLRAEFSSSQGPGGQIDQVTIPTMEIMRPPVFHRDLRMSEAPPPRLDTC